MLRAVRMIVAVASALLGLPAVAGAGEPPTATGVARQGSFMLASSVRLAASGGEMKGGWHDPSRPCSATRRLRVNIQIDLVVPAGRTLRVRRVRLGRPACSEDAPGLGLDLHPRALGLGCPDGRWRAGRYAMTIRTTDLARGLSASASLYRTVAGTCT
jgi:hypothetical protein